jgi:hypothetical protein
MGEKDMSIADDELKETSYMTLIGIIAIVVGSAFIGVSLARGAEEEPGLHNHPTIQKMLEENNRHRKRRGHGPHIINAELCKAAQDHADYMSNGGMFSHGSNGGHQGRANKFGYEGSVRENIAYGQLGIQSVFTTWINSGGHYASIMSGTSDAGFGLAYSSGTPYWVGLYGYPQITETVQQSTEGYNTYNTRRRGRRRRRG